jgi:Ca2+-binding RTX toxin-like protein
MRPASALLTCAVLAATLQVSSGPAEAAAPACQGKRATVVGGAGTGKNDVIVTNGEYEVNGKGGNDLICITKGRANVAAGAGDDTVVSKVKARYPSVSLGSGDDVYLGSDGEDNVYPGPGRDVIRTFGGPDSVYLGQGRPRTTVDLGAGDDRVTIARRSGVGSVGRAHVDGGPGADTVQVYVRGNRTTEVWRFDAVRGLATVDGKPVLHWEDFQTYDLTRLEGRAIEVVFRGSGDDETVDLGYGYGAGRRLDLRLRGGDDDVLVPAQDHGALDLGRGRDGWTVQNGKSAAIDLSGSGADLVLEDDTVSHFSLAGVDDVTTLEIVEVLLDGDDGSNKLRSEDVCAATLRGLGGDDKLDVDADACPDDQSASLEGGPGNDTLRGSYRDDLLDGGPGTDSANGESGQDTCYAEERLYCELP